MCVRLSVFLKICFIIQSPVSGDFYRRKFGHLVGIHFICSKNVFLSITYSKTSTSPKIIKARHRTHTIQVKMPNQQSGFFGSQSAEQISSHGRQSEKYNYLHNPRQIGLKMKKKVESVLGYVIIFSPRRDSA